MIIAAYAVAIALIFFSGLPALLVGRRSDRGERWSAWLLAAGALLGLLTVCGTLVAGAAPELAREWTLPGGRIALRLDGLAVVFLLPAFLICGLGGIYGLGYFPHQRHPRAAGRLRLLYGILAASITLLPACRNAILFLVAWELMALASFLLILTEQDKEAVRRAAFVYLTTTHVATLALYAFFILLATGSGVFDFPELASLDAATPAASAMFLLALFGFGLKAGIMPLHIWLPEAHAAAPSHVSALMSGVVIKMGIYGLVRMTSFFAAIPPWWGWTVLALGVISGVLGVAFAIAQHDIKRLLAYHSVENIGIILIGLGVALLGRTYAQPALVVLGLAGALLHVVNHGLFKSLLFFSAGAIINATGSRQLDSYGGLLKRMPITGLCFLGGAVAICGLPPLNGFVSEWLIYLGLLHSQAASAPFAVTLAVVAAPMLAMIGALAVACFVKVVGVTFLGEPRKAWGQAVTDSQLHSKEYSSQHSDRDREGKRSRDESVHQHTEERYSAAAKGSGLNANWNEAPASMTVIMVTLVACCAVIGVFPALVVPVLGPALKAWGVAGAGTDFPGRLAPVGWISISALLLLGLAGGLALWQRRRALAGSERPATWSCGYLWPSARMQYTASSFAEMLTGLFGWGLWTEIKGESPFGFFPALARLADQTPDVVLDRLLYPLCRGVSRLAFTVRSFLQHGVLGGYLLYVALTLFFLLFISLRVS